MDAGGNKNGIEGLDNPDGPADRDGRFTRAEVAAMVPERYRHKMDKEFWGTVKRMHLTNLVGSGVLDVYDLKIEKIIQRCHGFSMNIRMFSSLIIHLASPRLTILIYRRGVFMVLAATSINQAYLGCTKLELFLRRCGIECSVRGYRPCNFVNSVYAFSLDLPRLYSEYGAFVQYSDNFPGATIHCNYMKLEYDTKIKLEVFDSGKINVTGAVQQDEAMKVFVRVYFDVLCDPSIRRGGSKRKTSDYTPVVDISSKHKFVDTSDKDATRRSSGSASSRKSGKSKKKKRSRGSDDDDDDDDNEDNDSDDEDGEYDHDFDGGDDGILYEAYAAQMNGFNIHVDF